MKGLIYKVVNKEKKKVYIGLTTKSIEERKKDHIKKSKKGKNYSFQNAIATYGLDAFKWEQIDEATTIDELAKKEKEYIIKYNSKEVGYNMSGGGEIKKAVFQFDILTGKLVDKHSNLTDAGAVIGLSKQSLSKVCLSVNKASHGFYWSYEFKEYFEPIKDKRKKGVQQYSLDGKLIDEFISVSEASKKTSCNKSGIAKVCRGERKLCGNYIWKYI
ncbi:NUMOD1 domain-containing DNA-binding protein [Polaribacter septentrionalilitoris]|uniref:NUMOD1 domain-containing DNA-binding protein n=1 Tax=Polaribacter septentrionalilitoris TaxID=2494657 RepID=UPI001358382D|nr:NUMOD1 domain-containing DNA-binding protein [Polaribacter septentrionalilitoris]